MSSSDCWCPNCDPSRMHWWEYMDHSSSRGAPRFTTIAMRFSEWVQKVVDRSLILTRTEDGPDWLQCTEHKVSHWSHCDAPFYRVRPGCCPCPPSGAQSCRGPRLSQLTHWTAHRRHAGQSGSQTANSDDCAVMLFITRVADISLPSSSQSSHLCTLPHRHRPDIKLSWLTLDSGHWIRN